MNSYLLRAEAVNLGNFVYDTNKIQPTRGGSFLLLESVQQLDGKIVGGVKLEKITTGASIGLYRFNIDNGVKPEDVADEALKVLNTATGGHATFSVTCVEDTRNFKADLLKLQTKVRWRQYQQPTLILPDEVSAKGECAYDGVRPVGKESEKETGKQVSDSVADRIEKGRPLRQTIYGKILKNITTDLDFKNMKFTDNLEELAGREKTNNLDNKIAFIYFDGNKFTKIRTELCGSSKELESFGTDVENPRKEFLRQLLEKAAKDPDFKNGKDVRLETLLWGGDELEIVVPAWKGWDVLNMFFDAMGKASYKNEAGEEVNLTHAGGVVFCGHKAPIREIRRMANELAEMAKSSIKDDFKDIDTIKSKVNHKQHDTFRFLVLESVDTVGGKIEPFAKSYFGATIWQGMRLCASDMEKLTNTIKTMKENRFPRNKIFKEIIPKVREFIEERDEIVKARKPADNMDAKQKEFLDKLMNDILDGNEAKDTIKEEINKFTGAQLERWFVISELWDYVHAGGEA